MSRAEVRAAVGTYLQNGITTESVPYLSTVWPAPPKLANESDFYSAEVPGEGFGAQIFIYIGPTDRTRIAVGAKSPITNQYGGRKFVVYQTALMCYTRSTNTEAQDAAAENDTFLDGLIAWIEQDRNLGTAPQGIGPGGGVPTGSIFQAGEGGINEGPDLQVHSLLPKVNNRYGTLTTFTSVEMKVCQVDAT